MRGTGRAGAAALRLFHQIFQDLDRVAGRTAGADGSPSENQAEDDTPSDPATQSGKPQEDAEEEDHTPPPETDHTPPELEEKPDTKPSSQPERPRGAV